VLLTPRYGHEPVLSVAIRGDGPHPLMSQRRRLEGLLADLSEAEWQHPSRCAGWSVQDVVTHLISTNGFWALSIEAGIRGEPTEFLAAFDPVASPAQLVERGQGTPVEETLGQLTASTAALGEVITGLVDADWERLAEAPPGHLPVHLVADHALWDCWVHERDIVLPLGRPAVVDDDEVLTCLRYAAGLGRAFEVCGRRAEPGTVVLEVSDPAAMLVITTDVDGVRISEDAAPTDALRGRGDAVALLEMLSTRDVATPVPEAVTALTAGLAVVFDQTEPV